MYRFIKTNVYHYQLLNGKSYFSDVPSKLTGYQQLQME